MYALVDGNSFYASCERVYRPDLRDTPIVVLSNNDGCVITRSSQAKALGIKMGEPMHKIRNMVNRYGVVVFSVKSKSCCKFTLSNPSQLTN